MSEEAEVRIQKGFFVMRDILIVEIPITMSCDMIMLILWPNIPKRYSFKPMFV